MVRLDQEPNVQPRSLPELMGLAAAMEREAAARYAQLAADMTRRGDHGLAATFQVMFEEERDHLAGVEHWSQELTGRSPPESAEAWHLPPEIARSWDEVAESALLTPYQALSIAVLNEERSFAFYSYIAAHAADAAIRSAAERLASEELSHAALMRRERRRAYRRLHRATAATRETQAAPTTKADFSERARRMESLAAATHASIARRLGVLGLDQDAATLRAVADEEAAQSSLDAIVPASPETSAAEAAPQSRAELLRAGLAASERLYELYSDIADHAGAESVLMAAQDGAKRVVRQLGLIAARLHAPG